jgi:hypothetical protein
VGGTLISFPSSNKKWRVLSSPFKSQSHHKGIVPQKWARFGGGSAGKTKKEKKKRRKRQIME